MIRNLTNTVKGKGMEETKYGAGDIFLGRGKVQCQPYSMDGHLGKILASRLGVAGTEDVRLWLTNRYKRLCYILRRKPTKILGCMVFHC